MDTTHMAYKELEQIVRVAFVKGLLENRYILTEDIEALATARGWSDEEVSLANVIRCSMIAEYLM